MFSFRSAWVVVLVAASLYGCGGGGSDPPPMGSEKRPIPGPPTALYISGIPTLISTRTVLMITVQSVDANKLGVVWNGTVHVSSTDPAAVITPSDIQVTAGMGSGQITFETPGSQSVTVTDNGSALKPETYTSVVTAAPPLTIASGTPPGGVVGFPYSSQTLIVCADCGGVGPGIDVQPESLNFFALTSTGGVGILPPSFAWSAQPGSALPPGLSIQPLSACCALGLGAWEITGTPSQAGTYKVVVTVTDSGLPGASATANYTLVIAPAQAPMLSTVPGPQGATVNQNYSYDFAASGVQPMTVTESGPLPPGLTLSSQGHLGGTPTLPGSFPISVTATDGLGNTTVRIFTLEVFQHGFTLSGALVNARFAHSATLLSDGRILVLGGAGSGNTMVSSELYDTVAQTAHPGAMLSEGISNHTATLLCDLSHPPCNNPRILIAGGFTNSPFATVYDPAANAFTQIAGVAEFLVPHMNATATLLANGKVLVAGGTTDSADLFDPGSNSFPGPWLAMSTQRTAHTATLLANGKVLIAGGYAAAAAFNAAGPVLSSVEMYDPNTGTFTAAGYMTVARASHTATALADGRILLAGGFDSSGPLASAELYDPATGLFTQTGNLVTPRAGHTAVLLPNGLVLVAGGQHLNTLLRHAELFDPASGTFSNTGSMQVPRILHTMTGFGALGQVEVIGGTDTDTSHPLSSTELYQ